MSSNKFYSAALSVRELSLELLERVDGGREFAAFDGAHNGQLISAAPGGYLPGGAPSFTPGSLHGWGDIGHFLSGGGAAEHLFGPNGAIGNGTSPAGTPVDPHNGIISAGSAPGAHSGLPGGAAFDPHGGLGPNGTPLNGQPNVYGGLPGTAGAGPYGGLNGTSPYGGLNGNAPMIPYGGLGGVPNGSTGGGGLHTGDFNIHNWGDPHVTVQIDGHQTHQIDTKDSLGNFETFSNTYGGGTQVSTITTDHNQQSASFNKEVDFQNAHWQAAVVADGNGHLGIAVNDAQGAHRIEAGQSVTEADGTVISNHDGTISITQMLNDGGHVTTELTQNGAGYIDFTTSGHGNLGLTGMAADNYTQEFGNMMPTTGGQRTTG